MYENRNSAGRILAQELNKLTIPAPELLAIPRGGVVVAAPIADQLNLPLDILITRKIGHPLNPEIAIGAVMPDGTALWNQNILASSGGPQTQLQPLAEQEFQEIQRRLTTYTGSSSATLTIRNKTVIIVDDGIATGYTIKAAILWLKSLSPAGIILAVPVAPPEILTELAALTDRLICPLQPLDFQAVGQYYQDFSQTTDSEVINILRKTKKPNSS